MLWNFALRNVLRNKKRSLLTGLSIFFAGMIVTFTEGWVNGMTDTMIRNYIQFQTGNIRITTEEFNKRERFLPMDENIQNVEKIKKDISTLRSVESVVERIRFGIILSKEDRTVFATGMGLELLKDPLNVNKHIIEGNKNTDGIHIGFRLASKLKVKPGDELLLATKTSHGGLNGIKLKINGIFKFGMKLMDEKFFFIGIEQANRLLKLKDQAPELYVFLKKIPQTPETLKSIKMMIPENLVAKDYIQQMGGLYEMFQISRYFTILIEFIILFIASFVVINTMMMSVFERMREIGTLRAMGMTTQNLTRTFLYEGMIIGAAGGISGVLIGYSVVSFFSWYGINLEAYMGDIELPIEYIVYPSASGTVLLVAMGLAVLVPAVASMYPAYYTRKIEPAVALHQ